MSVLLANSMLRHPKSAIPSILTVPSHKTLVASTYRANCVAASLQTVLQSRWKVVGTGVSQCLVRQEAWHQSSLVPHLLCVFLNMLFSVIVHPELASSAWPLIRAIRGSLVATHEDSLTCFPVSSVLGLIGYPFHLRTVVRINGIDRSCMACILRHRSIRTHSNRLFTLHALGRLYRLTRSSCRFRDFGTRPIGRRFPGPAFLNFSARSGS